MAAIDDLIKHIQDENLRSLIADEVSRLREAKDYGLVFDRHLPEKTTLPTAPVGQGATVTLRNPVEATKQDNPLWLVTNIHDGVAELSPLNRSPIKGVSPAQVAAETPPSVVEAVRKPVDDLAVVWEVDSPTYPGLELIDSVETAETDAPHHTVINGENLHALQMLLWTHENKIDAIYIDPPYNTGNDGFTYNDKRIDTNDANRHSKWLSFMERRLVLARRLLKESGVLFLSIDDNEYANLKLLCNQVFGEENFIATASWQGFATIKNNAKLVSRNCEYVLLYAVSSENVVFPGVPKGDEQAKRYKNPADDPRGPYATSPLHVVAGSNSDRREPRTFSNGQTWQPPPGTAWRFTEDALAALDADGRLNLDPAGKKAPRRRTYWAEVNARMPLTTFWKHEDWGNTMLSNQEVGDLIGKGAFSFPKPTKLLARLIDATTTQDALILDFFAGSGTTAHAVLKLNAEDGGTRQCILVTNNEVDAKQQKQLLADGYQPGSPEWEASGVFHRVTKPRITSVVTGKRPDGTEHKYGATPANVNYYNLTYENPDRVEAGLAFEHLDPLLWLRAGGVGGRVGDPAGRDWVVPEQGRYAVLFNADCWREFVDHVHTLPQLSHVFVVADSDAVFQRVCTELSETIEVVRLYQAYSEAYNTGV